MRFYFQQRGELTDEGIDYPDAEEALRQAADAALSMAIEQLDETMGELTLDVSSQDGPIGSVTVRLLISRSSG
ncbi:DUF6894 family protein [Bradyrhizobium sp. CCGB01]|nr:hypothetical protein [Bradyrhizobium sp. CCGB01]MCP3410445.1 hypothetical protein [Bradyrhizobium sp. CCGB01]